MEFNRFDVTTKELVWDDPASWLERLGLGPREAVEVVDSDITALSAAADKVLRVGGPSPFLVNIEFQSSHDLGLTRTLWFRQTALDYRHGLPVLTVVILLRKEANSPALTGVYERHLPDGGLTNRYDYQVVRLWNEEVEPYLTAGIGLVPLAPLTDVRERDLPGVIHRMADRINQQPAPLAAKLWTATYLLMGLRFDEVLTTQLLEGVQIMHESRTYEKILTDGRREEARRMLIRQGTKRFRAPDANTIAALEAIREVDRLEALGERMIDPDLRGWDDLLAGE